MKRGLFFGLLALIVVLPLSLLVARNDVTVAQPSVRMVIPSGLQDYERWFGSLHAHVGMDGDDGVGTSAEAFAYVNRIPHLDFYALTPHLHFPTTVAPSLWSETTYDQIRLDAADECETLVCFAGVEPSTLSSGGHFNYFNDVDLIDQGHTHGDWNDDDDYYDHIVERGKMGYNVVAQFNHPEMTDFGNRYDAAADAYFGTCAVSSGYTGAWDQIFVNNGANIQFDAPRLPYENAWAHLLDLGWHVSPSADQDNHKATWGASSSEYTVIVRPRGTRLHISNVLQGLRDHMTYATEDPNMAIGFTANGWSMGQVIASEGDVHFEIWWDNLSEAICNGNTEICITEPPNDVVRTIAIYKNEFCTAYDGDLGCPVLVLHPNTASGFVDADLYNNEGDWFVLKFFDSKTLAHDPVYGRVEIGDQTWSAPVWVDSAHADDKLMVPALGITGITPTPLATPPMESPAIPTPTGVVYFPIVMRGVR